MARNSKGRSHISVMTVLPRRAFSWHESDCLCEDCVNNNNSNNNNSCHSNQDTALQVVQLESGLTRKGKRNMAGTRDEIRFWQDKFNRLLESHRKLQKVNQSLEDKLLKIVDKYESEKSSFTSDLADLSSRLVSAHYTISDLEDEMEQYRNDCNLAVQLLRCKPSSFVAHKVSSLPCDLQEKVRTHVQCRDVRRGQSGQDAYLQTAREPKTICIPVTSIPPSTMLYSVNNCEVEPEQSQKLPDLVSASILARVLEERAKERTGQCKGWPSAGNTSHKATQTYNMSVHLNLKAQMESYSKVETVLKQDVRRFSNSSTETDV